MDAGPSTSTSTVTDLGTISVLSPNLPVDSISSISEPTQPPKKRKRPPKNGSAPGSTLVTGEDAPSRPKKRVKCSAGSAVATPGDSSSSTASASTPDPATTATLTGSAKRPGRAARIKVPRPAKVNAAAKAALKQRAKEALLTNPKWKILPAAQLPKPKEIPAEQSVTKLTPRLWTGSREEYLSIFPEMTGNKAFNGVSWYMYDYPTILLDETNMCWEVVKLDDLTFELSTTRSFALPPRQVDSQRTEFESSLSSMNLLDAGQVDMKPSIETLKDLAPSTAQAGPSEDPPSSKGSPAQSSQASGSTSRLKLKFSRNSQKEVQQASPQLLQDTNPSPSVQPGSSKTASVTEIPPNEPTQPSTPAATIKAPKRPRHPPQAQSSQLAIRTVAVAVKTEPTGDTDLSTSSQPGPSKASTKSHVPPIRPAASSGTTKPSRPTKTLTKGQRKVSNTLPDQKPTPSLASSLELLTDVDLSTSREGPTAASLKGNAPPTQPFSVLTIKKPRPMKGLPNRSQTQTRSASRLQSPSTQASAINVTNVEEPPVASTSRTRIPNPRPPRPTKRTIDIGMDLSDPNTYTKDTSIPKLVSKITQAIDDDDEEVIDYISDELPPSVPQELMPLLATAQGIDTAGCNPREWSFIKLREEARRSKEAKMESGTGERATAALASSEARDRALMPPPPVPKGRLALPSRQQSHHGQPPSKANAQQDTTMAVDSDILGLMPASDLPKDSVLTTNPPIPPTTPVSTPKLELDKPPVKFDFRVGSIRPGEGSVLPLNRHVLSSSLFPLLRREEASSMLESQSQESVMRVESIIPGTLAPPNDPKGSVLATNPTITLLDSSKDPQIPNPIPPELQALVDAYISGKPLSIVMSVQRIYDLWEFRLPNEYGCAMMGFFRVIGVEELRLDVDDVLPIVSSGTSAGKVRWRFRLLWAPGGENALHQSDWDKLQRPWWSPRSPAPRATRRSKTGSSKATLKKERSAGVPLEASTPSTPPLPEPEDEFNTPARYRELRKRHRDHQWRHDSLNDLYFYLFPPHLLVNFDRFLSDSNFPRGWICPTCGRLNFQKAIRYRKCAGSLCKDSDPQKYCLSLFAMRDPQDRLTPGLPLNTYPRQGVKVKHARWADATQMFSCLISPEANILAPTVSIKHIFTGNLPKLQMQATDWLMKVQLEVEIERKFGDNGPFFSYHAKCSDKEADPHTSKWSNVPDCVNEMKTVMVQRAKWFAEMKDADIRVDQLDILSWVTTGKRKRSTPIRAKKKAVLFVALGCNIVITVSPRSLKEPSGSRSKGADITEEQEENVEGTTGWIEKDLTDDLAGDTNAQDQNNTSLKKRTVASGAKKDAFSVTFTMVHGDSLVFLGDDFEYSIKRDGTSFRKYLLNLIYV